MSFFGSLPDAVSVYEVSPRDGLQNEAVTVPTTRKIRLIEGLVHAGLKRIEATSFVSPRWVPQLGDAEEVCSLLPRDPGVTFSALCPNEKGLERAIAAKIPEIGVFMSASETHNRKNVNKTTAATLEVFHRVIGPAIRSGMRVRGYVSTMWGCPYEGDIDPKVGLSIAKQLLSEGCYQISLGDTIGVGTPRQTRDILQLFLAEIPADKIAMHMHDTRGTALANIVVGLEMGIRTFDAAVGGLGGCPYAPGATGNIVTEDLVFLLESSGFRTGIDIEKLMAARKVLAEAMPDEALYGFVPNAGLPKTFGTAVAA